jgi:hypothetical protein
VVLAEHPPVLVKLGSELLDGLDYSPGFTQQEDEAFPVTRVWGWSGPSTRVRSHSRARDCSMASSSRRNPLLHRGSVRSSSPTSLASHSDGAPAALPVWSLRRSAAGNAPRSSSRTTEQFPGTHSAARAGVPSDQGDPFFDFRGKLGTAEQTAILEHRACEEKFLQGAVPEAHPE